MSENRVCWNILARKAQSGVDACQADLARATDKQQHLQASRQRLVQLYDEYRLQEQTPEAKNWDAQVQLNHRQFMSQLLRVQERLNKELRLAGLTVQQAAQALVRAQVELRKMSTLEAQQEQKIMAARETREQHRLDEIAMMRFNLKTHV